MAEKEEKDPITGMLQHVVQEVVKHKVHEWVKEAAKKAAAEKLEPSKSHSPKATNEELIADTTNDLAQAGVTEPTEAMASDAEIDAAAQAEGSPISSPSPTPNHSSKSPDEIIEDAHIFEAKNQQLDPNQASEPIRSTSSSAELNELEMDPIGSSSTSAETLPNISGAPTTASGSSATASTTSAAATAGGAATTGSAAATSSATATTAATTAAGASSSAGAAAAGAAAMT